METVCIETVEFLVDLPTRGHNRHPGWAVVMAPAC